MNRPQFPVILLLLISVLLGCDKEVESNAGNTGYGFLKVGEEAKVLGPRADSCAYFPGKGYDRIVACKIQAAYSFSPQTWMIGKEGELPKEFLISEKALIPAHDADLNVAINLSPRHPYLGGLACHEPDFAFAYQSKGKTVALLTLSTHCGTVHFEPPAPHRMSLKGFTRLLTVLQELEL